jgi:Lrp/AsnC family transcriptional regulator, regulator for asnA, asnC and gidA
MSVIMNEKDIQLIYELQEDPRRPNTELAAKLGISEASVRRHIADLITSKAILPTVITSPSKLGYKIRAFISLEVDVAHINAVAKQLTKYTELPYVVVCAGSRDILAYATFTSNDHLSQFVSTELGNIEGIISIETIVELKCLKTTHGRLQRGVKLSIQSGR